MRDGKLAEFTVPHRLARVRPIFHDVLKAPCNRTQVVKTYWSPLLSQVALNGSLCKGWDVVFVVDCTYAVLGRPDRGFGDGELFKQEITTSSRA